LGKHKYGRKQFHLNAPEALITEVAEIASLDYCSTNEVMIRLLRIGLMVEKSRRDNSEIKFLIREGDRVREVMFV
jgi:hypothetical protein